MIPDFKTYLNESVWGDIRKKSIGQERRIENDVDNMEPADFYEYIDSRYKGLTKETKISAWGPNLNFSLLVLQYETKFPNSSTKSFIHVQQMESNKKGRIVRITDTIDKTSLFNKLKKNFTVERGWGSYEIYPFEAMSTNRLFLNVVDFLLENAGFSFTKCIKEAVNESVWGEIRKKSLGQEERIEDDVELMDFNGFGEYLRERYKFIVDVSKIHQFAQDKINYWIDNSVGIIIVPIECAEFAQYDRSLRVEKDLSIDEYMCIIPNNSIFDFYQTKLYDTFKDKYDLDASAHTVTPKEGKITNSVIVDVIDRLLGMVKKPTLNIR